MAMAVSVLVTSLAIRWLMSSWLAENRLLHRAEVNAMWASIHRVVAMDAHASTQAGILWGGLTLKEASQASYRYAVNSAGQYVRIRQGGGSAVLADYVRQADVWVYGGRWVYLQVTFDDGDVKKMIVSTLAAWGA